MTKNYSNRLSFEKSPYLLQHAHNPVDWYPWGEDAFEKAREEDKLIFLSIGYSTCHWCHVMERESFEDKEVAEVLNKNYISIKVDREERPDIDTIYMNVCQAISGHGGWPLTIIMTPDKKPFYAGTYFPKTGKYGRPGLIEILMFLSKKWKTSRGEIINSTESIFKAVKAMYEKTNSQELNIDVLKKAFNDFNKSFDDKYGGFGTEPKFPTPHNLMFLLRYWKITNSKRALEMVEKTLEGMYRGGLYDHIGFGFSRYSTDKKWLVPHFEKMLYDNALLSILYIEAYLATGKEIYKEIGENVFKYILRDMSSVQGGFYTAEDADSEGIEGKFYTWDPSEVKKILGEEDGNFYCSYYDIGERGNFEGKSIPNLINNSNQININDVDLKTRLENCRVKLFDYRNSRVHPYKDDKILTSWNGMMISALAIGGRVMNNSDYIIAAENAMDFILKELVQDNGRLLARYRDGESKYLGYLDDYGYIIWSLLELFESTGNTKYLNKAIEFNNNMIELFYDKKNGGFFLYGNDSERLIVRPKEVYDGAIPSGNSIATYVLIKLSQILENNELKELSKKQLKTFGGDISTNPISHAFMLIAYSFYSQAKDRLVLVGDINNHNYRKIKNKIDTKFLPFTLKIYIDKKSGTNLGYKMIDNKITLYLCKNFACLEPVNNIDEILSIIDNL